MKLKLALSISIIAACTLAGQAMAQTTARRCQFLSETIRAIRLLQIQIMDMLEPLQQALANTESALFQKIALEMNRTKMAVDVWVDICGSKNDFDTGLLDDMEKKLIERTLRQLGCSGRAAQAELLDTCRDQLEMSLQNARTRLKEVSKLYTSLGFLFGVLIVVLIV